jgi:hypothetical protein
MSEPGADSYEQVYAIVKAAERDYGELLATRESDDSVRGLRRLCEMILVREYDDWYVGPPTANISSALHRFCEAVNDKQKPPLALVRRAAACLAWVYVHQDHNANDAYLLLEAVMSHPGRFLPDGKLDEMTRRLGEWRDERGIPADLSTLNPHELAIWHEVQRWEVQPTSMWAPFSARFDEWKDSVVAAAPEAMMKAMTDAVHGGLVGIQDIARHLVREQAILDEVRAKGTPVDSVRDLRNVDIRILDQIAAASMAGGKVMAGLEGAGAGMGGLVTIVADIPAVMTINLRFISQIAHTYGFETSTQEEQTFALNILGAASADQASKTAFLNGLNKIAMDVARKQTWKQLDQHAFVALARKIAQQIGVRLTKAKLAQLVPVVGSAVGGGVNYAYTHDNLSAARMIYRKRYLIERCVHS